MSEILVPIYFMTSMHKDITIFHLIDILEEEKVQELIVCMILQIEQLQLHLEKQATQKCA